MPNPIYEPNAMHIVVDLERSRFVLEKPVTLAIHYQSRPITLTIPAGTAVAGGPELVALRSNLALRYLTSIGASNTIADTLAREIYNQDFRTARSTESLTEPPPFNLELPDDQERTILMDRASTADTFDDLDFELLDDET